MASSKTKHAFFDYPFPIPFAHRGGDEVCPENTMAAFENAYALGYRYFETDVHYTVGQELVAFHDSDLLRTAGSSGKVADLTAAQRKGIRFEDKYPMPLLSELLEAFPDAYFNIDAKSEAAVRPLVKTLQKHNALRRVCLASFSSRRIKQLRLLAPATPTGATPYEIVLLRTGLGPRKKVNSEPHYLEMPAYAMWERQHVPLITRDFVNSLHTYGHKVFIWTINEETAMNHLLDMGVDGLFTDKPRLLKQVLVDRHEWHNP